MSDHDPGTTPSMQDFEFVGHAPKVRSPRPSRKHFAGFAAAAVAVAAVGAGVWAWQAWSEQGAQPSEVLPATTLAYVAVDLDPPAGQKVAAFRTLRKFPSIRHDLGLDDVDQVRRSVVEGIASDNDCHLNYPELVKPWIGDRLAFAVVKQARPEFVGIVQVKDADKARSSLASVSHSCRDGDFGWVVDGDWAVIARNGDVARRVLSDAKHGTLDKDADFRRLTAAAGDAGVVTAYAAPEAGPALLDEIDRDPLAGFTALQLVDNVSDPVLSYVGLFGLFYTTTASVEDGGVSSSQGSISPELEARQRKLDKRWKHADELSDRQRKRLEHDQDQLLNEMYGSEPGAQDDSIEAWKPPAIPAALRSSLQHFTGLGGAARFNDGSLEVELVSGLLEGTSSDLYAGSAGDDGFSELPDDTAIAYGAGLEDGWAGDLMTQLSQQFSFTSTSAADATASFEKATGLDVPGDLEDLGGDHVTVMAGSGFAPEKLDDDPGKVAVAARISGDPDRVEAALDKVRARVGTQVASHILSRRVGDDVLVGPDSAYLDELAGARGDLRGTDRFEKVVPEAKDATTALFVDFDAGEWLTKAVGPGSDRKDAEPLDTLGLTMTKDSHQQRMLLRITFD